MASLRRRVLALLTLSIWACSLAVRMVPRAAVPRLHATRMCALEADGVTPLTSLAALRGPVASGFGRGSKKLGVPTANLPCSLFQEQLASLECGVYVGWASVRGEVHKCVANIGFSPTFDDEANREKIVEVRYPHADQIAERWDRRADPSLPTTPQANLLHAFDDDFYDETLTLLLLGFIRPERRCGPPHHG